MGSDLIILIICVLIIYGYLRFLKKEEYRIQTEKEIEMYKNMSDMLNTAIKAIEHLKEKE